MISVLCVASWPFLQASYTSTSNAVHPRSSIVYVRPPITSSCVSHIPRLLILSRSSKVTRRNEEGKPGNEANRLPYPLVNICARFTRTPETPKDRPD